MAYVLLVILLNVCVCQRTVLTSILWCQSNSISFNPVIKQSITLYASTMTDIYMLGQNLHIGPNRLHIHLFVSGFIYLNQVDRLTINITSQKPPDHTDTIAYHNIENNDGQRPNLHCEVKNSQIKRY